MFAESYSTAAAAANNEPYIVLHSFLKMETRERSRQARERSESHREKAMTGLPVSQQEALAATIFGRGTSSASRTDAQNRFLKSHLEMGYPQHGKSNLLFAVSLLRGFTAHAETRISSSDGT